MNIDLLVKLASKAWSLKILALMDVGVPGRQASLIAETNASRPSFAASLEHLIQMGMVERNPGHGHPLRPEFRLTKAGVVAAGMASRVLDNVPDSDGFDLMRRNWTAPILAVTSAPQRFSVIKQNLGTITDRALSKSLHALEERDWLRRQIDLSDRNPFPTYHAVNAGLEINQAIGLCV